LYAKVVVDTGPTTPFDSLTYEIPDDLERSVGMGSCVLVPLGARQVVGFVIALEADSDVSGIRRIIAEVDSPVRLTSDALDLARWIASEYVCALPRAVLGMLPGVMQCRVQTRILPGDAVPGGIRLGPVESRVLSEVLDAQRTATMESLARGADKSAVISAVRRLEEKGAVRRVWSIMPAAGKPRVMKGVRIAESASVVSSLPKRVSAEQTEALETIRLLGRAVSIRDLVDGRGVSESAISTLLKRGVLERVDVTVRRTPDYGKHHSETFELTPEQSAAVDTINASIDSGVYRGHLIHGVTGSGKTEVYMRAVEHALAADRTALVLLPEIALTTQVMSIFRGRFGEDVAVLHSAMGDGERCDEWSRVESGEARVVLGARSAVFAPLADLGLIVVDEEHEAGSYKQDNPPRYHGRDVAVRRARTSAATLVLGSATPSVESYQAAANGDIGLIELSSRVAGRSLPLVHVVDLRQSYAQGRVSIFSSLLEEKIAQRLARGEQVMLLQNRRAYSTFLLCRDCGLVMRCPHCAVSLKLHAAARKLSCHHCDHQEPAPDVCPSCEGRRIGKFGIGTERVEEETRNTFSGARVIRMDRDTTSRKGSHADILQAFRRHEADILVGTQMIAKGLDFPNVTLVGVISADTSLNLPDFRATERTYQLLSQVAGRSGRGETPGEVVIQTFDPDNHAIRCAVNHDYESFCARELEMRRELNYPPFASIVNILSRDSSERAARVRLEDLLREIKAEPLSDRAGLELAGPTPAVLSRLRGEYRYHLVARSGDRERMLALIRRVLDRRGDLHRQLSVDVDPVSML